MRQVGSTSVLPLVKRGDDDEQGLGEGGVDFNNSDDDGLKALCTMFCIELPPNFSRALDGGRHQALGRLCAHGGHGCLECQSV